MKIEAILSSPVVATRKDTKIKYVRDQISRKGVHALPVLDEDGTIEGIISSADVAKSHDEESSVEQFMTPHVHIVLKNNRVQDAAKVMLKHGVHHVVVMEGGQVIGMVSSLDIIDALLSE